MQKMFKAHSQKSCSVLVIYLVNLHALVSTILGKKVSSMLPLIHLSSIFVILM